MGKDRLCGGALKSLISGQGGRVLCVMNLERELEPRWQQVEEFGFDHGGENHRSVPPLRAGQP